MLINVVGGVGLFILSLWDIRTKKIPVVLTVLWGVLLFGCRVCRGLDPVMAAAGMIPGAVILVLSVLSNGKIGLGDGLVLCALGAGFGTEAMVVILSGAFGLAALGAVALIVFQKAGRNREMPFLPYVFAGYVVCMITG